MSRNDIRKKQNWIFDKLDLFLNTLNQRFEERSKRIFAGLAVIAACPFLFLFSIVHLMAGDYLLGPFLLLMGFIVMGSVFVGRYFENAINIYRIDVISLGLLCLFLIATSEFFPNRLLWSFIFPLIAFYLLGRKEGLLCNLIFFVFITLLFLFQDLFKIPVYPDAIFKTEFFVSLFMAGLISYSLEDVKSEYENGMRQRQSALEKEKEKLSKAKDELQVMFERVKEAEKELSVLNTELEKRVEERTEELQEVNQRLKLEIGERQRAAIKLFESEEKYRALFEESLEAMSLTRNGRIIDVNPAWVKVHGYEHKGDVIGMDVVNIIHPDDLKTYIESWSKGSGNRSGIKQMRDLRNDGTPLDVEVYSSDIDIGGQRSVLTTIRDITERKKDEIIKRDLEEKLRRAEKMEAIGVLAGGVAHDLNNILSGLVGYPELLLMELPENSPLRKGVQTIQKSGQKAASIVQDLLTLARRGVKNIEVVNLNRIISDFSVSPEFEKIKKSYSNIALNIQLEEKLLNIEGSAIHLTKTLMNLITNASEAMQGGGELLIKTQNRYIDKPISGYDHVEEGDYVVVVVSDTGMGIPGEDLERIFEPFFTKKAMGRSGTGLGMTVVWGTVKDHRGYIDVESIEGEGTTFTLYFPATRKEIEEDSEKISLDTYMGNGETILVVDDIEQQREMACDMLQRLNYTAQSVQSGEEAVEYVKENKTDLLVLDMIMEPGIDGFETYKRVLEYRPNQRAVIASGFAETDNVRGAQKLGAGPYIKKPYTLEELGKAVKSELEKNGSEKKAYSS